MHHPFTAPLGDLDDAEATAALGARKAYDLVLNGIELGGGSIRIHPTATCSRRSSAARHRREEAQARFGFLLDALRYGRRRTAASRSASTASWCCWPSRLDPRRDRLPEDGAAPGPADGAPAPVDGARSCGRGT